MDACYCDYDSMPTVYRQTTPTARKAHKCGECAAPILPGEKYENCFGVWDGDASTFKVCGRCQDLREWVKAHVPCFCWYYGNIRGDAIETARGYAHEAPGLLFGAYRREVRIQQAARGAA